MKEKDIYYENGHYWIFCNKKDEYHVMISGITHSISESSYDDASLAIARVDYLAKTHTDGKNYDRFNAIKRINICLKQMEEFNAS